MATIPKFLSVLSRFDGRGEEELADYAQFLRSPGGLLPRTRRGLGSLPVSPRMAAVMLLATFSDRMRRAPRLVERYGSLRPLRTISCGLGVLDEAARQPTLLDALEHLMRHGPKLKAQLLDELASQYGDVDVGDLFSLHAVEFELVVEKPGLVARIDLLALGEVGMKTVWSCVFCIDPVLMQAGYYREELQSSFALRRTVISLPQAAIFELSDTINDTTEA